jgi:hypothetical protein
MRAHERHQAAVARSLAWAKAAADEGDYDDALAWLGTVESVAPELPAEWQRRRREWEAARRRETTDSDRGGARSSAPSLSGRLAP